MGRKFSSDDLQNTQEKMLQDYMEVAQQKLNARQKMQLYTSTSTTSQSDLERDSGSATTSDLNLNSNHSSASNLAPQQFDGERLKLDVDQTRRRIETLKAELNNSVGTYLNPGAPIPAPHNPARPDAREQRSTTACGAGANCSLGMPCKLFDSDQHIASVPPSFLHRDSNTFQQNNDMVERLCLDLEALLSPNSNHQTAHPHDQDRLERMDSISARQSSYPETSFPAHNKLPGKNLSETSLLKMMYISEKEKLEKLKRHLTLIENETDSQIMGNDKERILLMQRKDKLLKEFKKIISHKSGQEEIDMVNRNIQSLERDLQGALESSNKTISDRIKLQNEKTKIMKELQSSMEEIAKIEEKLKISSNLEIGEKGVTEEETLTPKHKYVKREPSRRHYDSSPGQYHQLYLELLQKERELQQIYQSLLVNRGISSNQSQTQSSSSRHGNDDDDKDIIPQIYVSHYNDDPTTASIPDHARHHHNVNSNPSLNHPCLKESRYDALYQIANRYLSSSNGGNAPNGWLLPNGESHLNPDSSHGALASTAATSTAAAAASSLPPPRHNRPLVKNGGGGGASSPQAPKSKTITECYAFL